MPFLNRFGIYPDGLVDAAAAAAAAFARSAEAASFSRVGANIPNMGSNVGNVGPAGIGPAGVAFANGLNLMDPHVRAAIARVRAVAPNIMGPNHEHLALPNPWMMPR